MNITSIIKAVSIMIVLLLAMPFAVALTIIKVVEYTINLVADAMEWVVDEAINIINEV